MALLSCKSATMGEGDIQHMEEFRIYVAVFIVIISCVALTPTIVLTTITFAMTITVITT